MRFQFLDLVNGTALEDQSPYQFTVSSVNLHTGLAALFLITEEDYAKEALKKLDAIGYEKTLDLLGGSWPLNDTAEAIKYYADTLLSA